MQGGNHYPFNLMHLFDGSELRKKLVTSLTNLKSVREKDNTAITASKQILYKELKDHHENKSFPEHNRC